MDDKQNAPDNTRTKAVVIPPAKTVENANPKANENIRERTKEPKPQNSEPSFGVGSEITDGEDA